MEEMVKAFAAEAAKQGFLVLGLLLVVRVLWQDNVKLRKQLEDDQKAREERDDQRFTEVKALATQSAGALVQASSASAAQSAALENTNSLIEKQGALLEARTAVFQTIAASMMLTEAALKAFKDTLDTAIRRFER